MVAFRPVFKAVASLAFMGGITLVAFPMSQQAFAATILKVPAVPAPMTAGTAAPGVLDYDGIPTVEHASAANVAGLMSYCYSHKLVTDTTVRSLGRKLASREGVSTNPAYAWGGVGRLELGGQTMFDVGSLNRDQRAAVCARSALRGPDLLKSE
ncbi:hypothetical protein LHT11_10260 [Acetobacter indonesiensis]|uniref:hypothetical protein n=1 Tax=Acetobacter indonesiensis TaxID=104101 RepID=UPI001F17B4FA|nr:hypothetical protein [Acetobacter indonesiensis]MCG0995585.1 hypothetical protein [Acetobacter indonesiensis]